MVAGFVGAGAALASATDDLIAACTDPAFHLAGILPRLQAQGWQDVTSGQTRATVTSGVMFLNLLDAQHPEGWAKHLKWTKSLGRDAAKRDYVVYHQADTWVLLNEQSPGFGYCLIAATDPAALEPWVAQSGGTLAQDGPRRFLQHKGDRIEVRAASMDAALFATLPDAPIYSFTATILIGRQ